MANKYEILNNESFQSSLENICEGIQAQTKGGASFILLFKNRGGISCAGIKHIGADRKSFQISVSVQRSKAKLLLTNPPSVRELLFEHFFDTVPLYQK